MQTQRTAWLTAAATSATTAVFVASAIMDHGSPVTVVDVGALLVTGILAGLFLGFALRCRRPAV
jgi:hypothetical protein